MIELSNIWPYRPPHIFERTSLPDFWRPPCYLLLSEAVDVYGRTQFGEMWTGKEIEARPLGRGLSELPTSPLGKIHLATLHGINRLPIPGSIGTWRVVTTFGIVRVDSEKEAFDLWDEERPKLQKMWIAEIDARQRHDQIVLRLRADLHAGAVRAWVHRRDVGDIIEVPSDYWGRDGIESVFELGNDPTLWRNPNTMDFVASVSARDNVTSVNGRGIVLAADIDTYLNREAAKAALSGSATKKAERDCEEWIEKLAADGCKPANKEAVRKMAKKKFGLRLSGRGFSRAWDKAAPNEWRIPGQRRTELNSKR
jgi:hypothetical protein